MKDIVCIVCPNSCHLTKNNAGEIEGAKCKRGFKFYESETTNPTRVVTSTVKTAFSYKKVLPVKTDGEIPKKLMFECMKVINSICVDKKLVCGEIVVKDILGTGVDLVATSSI